MRELVHFADGDSGFGQAPGDGGDGEVAGMLFAAEPLFGAGRYELTIDDQSGGGVMALGDPVFALRKAGPMCFFELNGVSESTDPEHLHFECSIAKSRLTLGESSVRSHAAIAQAWILRSATALVFAVTTEAGEHDCTHKLCLLSCLPTIPGENAC
jgi:hypothetical protein